MWERFHSEGENTRRQDNGRGSGRSSTSDSIPQLGVSDSESSSVSNEPGDGWWGRAAAEKGPRLLVDVRCVWCVGGVRGWCVGIV